MAVDEQAFRPQIPKLLSKTQLSQLVRARAGNLIVDDAAEPPNAFAVYFLADPRDVRSVRYVGQTRSPARRFLQHVNQARLWVPDDTPWWFQTPSMRPLYEWIRELHRAEHRFPAMVITDWVETSRIARATERQRILSVIQQDITLFNIETERLQRQALLL